MILEFIKSFLVLFLLVKVLLYFVPKKVFEKYIAFFSGVILVIGLLYPLLNGLGQKEVILEGAGYEQWEAELLRIKEDAVALGDEGERMLEEYYDKPKKETREIESIAIETVKIESGMQTGDANE